MLHARREMLIAADGVGGRNLFSHPLLRCKDAQHEQQLQRGRKGAHNQVEGQEDGLEAAASVSDAAAQQCEDAHHHQSPGGACKASTRAHAFQQHRSTPFALQADGRLLELHLDGP